MVIVVDEAVPLWREAFGTLGEVRPCRGREIGSDTVKDADALIVRTVTRVGPDLLEESGVRFVGTATIGMDHLDLPYLDTRGITYSNAAGCNANAVSEYVAAALQRLAQVRGWNLEDRSLAVVGVGRVGSRVVRKAEAFGMKVMLCDPPLRDETGDRRYLDLEQVLGADVVSLHVPLTRSGPYPTWHMIEESVLSRMHPNQVLINTSRGPVVHGSALKSVLLDRRIGGAVLDVWEGEPRLDYALVDRIETATPHIAGYSLDGKIRATEMIREALCSHFGSKSAWDSSGFYPPPRELSPPIGGGWSTAAEVVQAAYDIRRDDAALRSLSPLNADDAAVAFERLRAHYAFRTEFHHFRVAFQNSPEGLESICRSLGFDVL